MNGLAKFQGAQVESMGPDKFAGRAISVVLGFLLLGLGAQAIAPTP